MGVCARFVCELMPAYIAGEGTVSCCSPASGSLPGPLSDAAPSPQLLCTLTFWLLLRQFVKEKLLRRAEPRGADGGHCGRHRSRQ